MTRRTAFKTWAAAATALCFVAAQSASFADSGNGQKSAPRIDVHVGKVTKKPDRPAKGGKNG